MTLEIQVDREAAPELEAAAYLSDQKKDELVVFFDRFSEARLPPRELLATTEIARRQVPGHVPLIEHCPSRRNPTPLA